jgi:hypothetical protein
LSVSKSGRGERGRGAEGVKRRLREVGEVGGRFGKIGEGTGISMGFEKGVGEGVAARVMDFLGLDLDELEL